MSQQNTQTQDNLCDVCTVSLMNSVAYITGNRRYCISCYKRCTRTGLCNWCNVQVGQENLDETHKCNGQYKAACVARYNGVRPED